MEVSFEPKSIENLSRTPTEKLSVLHRRHEHRDGPFFHLVWPKRKTTARLTEAVSKRADESKLWTSHQGGLNSLPCAHESDMHAFLAGCAKQD